MQSKRFQLNTFNKNQPQRIEDARMKVDALKIAYEKAKDDMHRAIIELQKLEKSDYESTGGNSSHMNKKRGISVLPRKLVPSEEIIVYNAKETIAFWLFGRGIAKILFTVSRSHVFRIYGLFCSIAPVISYLSIVQVLPYYMSYLIVSNFICFLIVFLLANRLLFLRLLHTFDTWYLMGYILIVVICSSIIMRPYQLMVMYVTLLCGCMVVFMDAFTISNKSKLIWNICNTIYGILGIAAFYFNWLRVDDVVYHWNGAKFSCISMSMNCMMTIIIFFVRYVVTCIMYPNHMVTLKSRLKKSSCTNPTSISSVNA